MSFRKALGASTLVFGLTFSYITEAKAQNTGANNPNNLHAAQRDKLQTIIDYAWRAGKISEDQAAELQADVHKNFDLQKASMKDGALSLNEREELLIHLSAISSRLETLVAQAGRTKSSTNEPLAAASKSPTIAPVNIETAKRRTQFGDEINTLRLNAEGKVAAALTGNQITAAQAASIRSMLSSTSTKQAGFMVDGRIDESEREQLAKDIGAASGALDSMTKVGADNKTAIQPNSYGKDWWTRNWDGALKASMVNRLSKMSERVERGKIRGRLTADEYSSLKADLDKLSTPNQFGFTGKQDSWDKSAFETAVSKLEMRVRSELTNRESAYRGTASF